MIFKIVERRDFDDEFSWQDSYKAPFVALPGLKEEVLIYSMSDFGRIAPQIKQRDAVRELLEDALSLYSCVRLIPVR